MSSLQRTIQSIKKTNQGVERESDWDRYWGKQKGLVKMRWTEHLLEVTAIGVSQAKSGWRNKHGRAMRDHEKVSREEMT